MWPPGIAGGVPDGPFLADQAALGAGVEAQQDDTPFYADRDDARRRCRLELFGRAIVREEAAPPASRHIAIDGKTLRGGKDENGDAEHCLSAFAIAVHKVLDHTARAARAWKLPMR